MLKEKKPKEFDKICLTETLHLEGKPEDKRGDTLDQPDIAVKPIPMIHWLKEVRFSMWLKRSFILLKR
ncbi:MAG: hypothetical protein K9L66_09125 [Spirochaetaceae bacterium]|nr:hypothetical protein [Spirochaetaceae bacterium]MCF7949874.1 hypothetical protein [Spirochaetia bacterium]MCF7951677.1 hypothetical protein [Spirochaetaceae bacterium]